MFVPLHDDTPLKVIRFQFVTLAIIAGNVIVFLMTGAFQSDTVLAGVADSFGVVPSDLTNAFSQNIPYSPIPEPLTFLTYMFLHAGWLHLISNMLFLWVFADNVEDAFGYFAFALFYLLCGIAGALAHVLMSPTSTAPLIGAS
ncbi:MAG: rhomboid family intramembrane serine protease, partial [Aestuariivirga sp.]